jgi:hypothetical protein
VNPKKQRKGTPWNPRRTNNKLQKHNTALNTLPPICPHPTWSQA